MAIAWLDPHEAASYHCWLPRIAPWRRSPLLKSARCLEEADLDEVSACLLALFHFQNPTKVVRLLFAGTDRLQGFSLELCYPVFDLTQVF